MLAPCAAEVLRTRDGVPDQPPGTLDAQHLLGNYVLLYCQDATIALAHLKAHSVRVQPGERVRAGALLGRVGNSGNTTEPHLHIHAVRGRITDLNEIGAKGAAVPMLFAGRFLIRNDRVPGASLPPGRT